MPFRIVFMSFIAVGVCMAMDTYIPLVDLTCLGKKVSAGGAVFVKTNVQIDPEIVDIIIEDGTIRDVVMYLKGTKGMTEETIKKALSVMYAEFQYNEYFFHNKDHSISIHVMSDSTFPGENDGYKISVQRYSKKFDELNHQ